MDSQLLREVGETLYGRDWQSPMAGDLEVSENFMRHLATGKAEVEDMIPMELLRIATGRMERLSRIIKILEAAVTPPRH